MELSYHVANHAHIYLTAEDEAIGTLTHFTYKCQQAGDKFGIGVSAVDLVVNVTTTVYQHIFCPVGLYGLGCEHVCNCSEREECDYIIGCHIGE